MNDMTRAEILDAARTLPPQELVALANELLELADDGQDDLPSDDWKAAWGAEAVRRLREMDEGKVQLVPAADVMARVRAIVRS